jgi:hypothetical protein
MLSTPKQREKMPDVRDLIDEFKCDEHLGQIAVIKPANLCKGSMNDNDQHSRKKLKIMDFSMFKDAVEVSRNQNDYIKKYVHIDVGHVDLNDLLDWWKKYEEEFRYLSRVSRNVLCVPGTSASSERNFSAAVLVVREGRTSLSITSVDSILFLHNMQ